MQTERLSVTGMKCRGCAGSVSRAVAAVDGVMDVDVDLASGTVTVRFDERATARDALAAAVRGAGYGVAGEPTERRPAAGGCCCG
ncbi:MAG: heavy-metal-associated domain-containing protein [Pseudomonadales bacterium]